MPLVCCSWQQPLCFGFSNGVSSRLVNSSCEHPENAQALFWKKASPEWSQVDQVVSRKPLGDTAALVVASTAHSEDTTIDSPNPAGNTLAPTITNAGGAVDQHQQQPPPSMPSSTVHHRISSAPIPVPTLKRAAHLSHHPCSDLPLSECSSPYVDRGSYFARANFKVGFCQCYKIRYVCFVDFGCITRCWCIMILMRILFVWILCATYLTGMWHKQL